MSARALIAKSALRKLPAGETTGITGGAHGNSTLTWTSTGKLATETTAHGSTSNVYDAGGNLIVQRNPSTTTLFLADEQIVQDNTTKVLTGTRFYGINGTRIAARNGGAAASYLIADRQGTGDVAVNTSTAAITRRQYLPFGEVRGSAVQWVGNNGYVGGADDANTGLETLGARQYDATVGRFLSADPVFESADPTQLSGYGYAGNDPISSSDPSGLQGSASCGAGAVGAIGNGGGGGYEGDCTGYENSDPNVTPPPRGSEGGWSGQKTTLSGGTVYRSSSKGESINGVVLHLPTDATTAWDIAKALDKYNVETGYAGPIDADSTPMGIAAAFNDKYIKLNTDDNVKYSLDSLYLVGLAGLLAEDSQLASGPLDGLGNEGSATPVRVPTGALGPREEPEVPTGDTPRLPETPKKVTPRDGGGADEYGNFISGSRAGDQLASQLRGEAGSSPFTANGDLKPEVIRSSTQVIAGQDILNGQLRQRFAGRGGVDNWGKYTTETYQSPYGPYQVHFYYNSTSREVMYDYDYKAVMNRR